MRGVWFHKRSPDEGVGYGIANRAGLLVSLGFVAVTTLLSVLPWLAGYRSAPGAVVGVALTIPAVLVFIGFIKRHSDDHA